MKVRLYDTETLSCTGSLTGHRDIVLCMDSAQTPQGMMRRGKCGRHLPRALLNLIVYVQRIAFLGLTNLTPTHAFHSPGSTHPHPLTRFHSPGSTHPAPLRRIDPGVWCQGPRGQSVGLWWRCGRSSAHMPGCGDGPRRGGIGGGPLKEDCGRCEIAACESHGRCLLLEDCLMAIL